MAVDTDLSLRAAQLYQIYPRSHTPEGTFRAMIGDLDRIRALGTDIIYLMPIHPVGEVGKKGSLGCPYANKDYRSVNPAYGTMEDFAALTEEIHARGMRVIIDVVYNHTSPDSTLSVEHPEFFYHKADGSFGNRFGDWSDVIDLDYSNRELWAYQIESLRMWARYVDGFRCDVASLVPLEFWKMARAACDEAHSGMIWLAETVHSFFNREVRIAGCETVFSDAEGYAAFDIEYDYDIREKLDAYFEGRRPLHEYVEAMRDQEALYPKNYVKLRCLENHDQPRIAGRPLSARARRSWHAFLFMQKGALMLYAGEEFSDPNRPSLFEIDPMCRGGEDISAELTRLSRIRKSYFPIDAAFDAEADDVQEAVRVRLSKGKRAYTGIFSLKGIPVRVAAKLHDGEYRELISGGTVRIKNGIAETDGEPWIIEE